MIALLCCAAKPVEAPPVVPQADGTFSITLTATNGFMRDTDKLKGDIQDQATAYCTSLGKQMKVVSLTSKKPLFSMGYISANIIFRALNPGETYSAGAPAALAPVEPPLTTDELVAALTKLDDLRKKGILTDEEFLVEKKKVLGRSK